MKHTIRRFIPVDSMDIPAMESWLSDLAEDGLFLVSVGSLFANFVSSAPRKAAYRLEPASALYMAPDEKKRELLEEFSWEYVCPLDKYFHIFRAKTEDAPEIHTDPAVQAEAYGLLYRSNRNWGILYALAFSVFLYIMVFTKKPGFFHVALLGISPVLQCIYMAAAAVLGIRQLIRLRKIRNLLRNGTPPSHSGNYHRKRLLRLSASVFVLLLLSATLISYAYGILVRRDADWRELSEPIPMVSLAEIEQDPNFRNGHIGDDATVYIGGDPDNEIRFRASFLVPEQVTVTQSGFVPGRCWVDDSKPYETTLEINLYCLRYPALGERFVKSQMDWELSGPIPWDTFDLTAETGMDEARLCISGKFSDSLKKLFLRQGDTIIYAEYFGEADLRPFVPQFSALMQEPYPTKKTR